MAVPIENTMRPERGYSDPGYAESLSEFGRPRLLAASRGWILERKIPETDAHDAMGCYPIFCCCDWSLLKHDLENIGKELVSLVLVADPFGDYSKELLCNTFEELVVRFKDHFVADLRKPTKSFVSKHHQYYARKALEEVSVERCENPAQMLDEWSALYELLVARHGLKGIKAFSRAAFAKQLTVPGLVMLRAIHEAETVGMHLWYVQGDVALSHLAATSDLGYKLMSAYALSWWAIDHFADKVQWIDWGAGAGLDANGTAGLTRFKRGWATETRPAYLCGRIFDHTKYEEIARAKGTAGSNYFPSYRQNELR